MTITHTQSYAEGRGIGKLLVDAAVNYAKENNLRIHPICSFAHHLISKNSEYSKLMD